LRRVKVANIVLMEYDDGVVIKPGAAQLQFFDNFLLFNIFALISRHQIEKNISYR